MEIGAAEASFAFDRASLGHLIADPAACEIDRIRASIERADHDDAVIRALARARLGLPLPAELVAELLVGVELMTQFFALARAASGELLHPLLELLRRARFGDDLIGAEQTIYTSFVLWQQQRPEIVRPAIAPRLRRLVRQYSLHSLPAGMVGWLATQLGDPHLTALYEESQADGDEAYARRLAEVAGGFVTEAWARALDRIIDDMPERAPEEAIAGVPIRAAPKVGRNELCPCGSGKKFKKCHADLPLPVGVAPSRAERLRALEPRLDRDQVRRLWRADLARLELTRLRDLTVIEVLRCQAQLHDWRRACLAADEIGRRSGEAAAAEHLYEVVHEALQARQYDEARRLLTRLDGVIPHDDLRLELALAMREPDALAQLEAAARAVVMETGEEHATDLACAALHTLPALGILIARGALRADDLLEAETLLEEIEEARDELALPPGDPAVELFEALGGVQEKQREAARTKAERESLAQTAASLRADLGETTDRLAALQRQVTEHQRELERAERTAAEASQRAARSAAEEQERRTLRSKIEELQGLIREGNEERGELRRQLSTAAQDRSGAPPAHGSRARGREPDGDGDDDGVEDLPAEAGARRVQIPRFGATAAAALETAPHNIAAAAMRTIGALAAGDPAAWRGVKQAKDMPRQVLMARIGIHHRLLFRGEGALDVLDLVTRESLMTTLKRLRSS